MALPVVILNPGCNYGTGRRRWEAVRHGLRDRIGAFEVRSTDRPDEVEPVVKEALAQGTRFFVAAGGDGTVNLLADALVRLGAADAVLGGVGLGSSNDFHKPFRPEDRIAGVPVRVDLTRSVASDVIRVEYTSPDGAAHTRRCLLNSSIGITAEANAYFNSRRKLIMAVQRVSVNLAVSMTAVRGVVVFRSIPVTLRLDDEPEQRLAITNLGVLKRRYFAGSLAYDTPVAPDSGLVAVNYCFGLNLFERLVTLAVLGAGRFKGRKKTVCREARRVGLRSEQPFALELDGETVQARSAYLAVVPKAIGVCV
jgi:diacylglycerol kinase (ATP)